MTKVMVGVFTLRFFHIIQYSRRSSYSFVKWKWYYHEIKEDYKKYYLYLTYAPYHIWCYTIKNLLYVYCISWMISEFKFRYILFDKANLAFFYQYMLTLFNFSGSTSFSLIWSIKSTKKPHQKPKLKHDQVVHLKLWTSCIMFDYEAYEFS